MADIVDRETRSRLMAGIRGKDTSPEIVVRRELHRRGFRFRLHRKGLPGRPDIVLPKYRALILVHGCFWHCHQCQLFKWPSTNRDRWRRKLETNVVRDAENVGALRQQGWRTLVIWECALKGPGRLAMESVGALVEEWLVGGVETGEIRGGDVTGGQDSPL
jgi:DNA mismatch endonuclease, patch repair protein